MSLPLAVEAERDALAEFKAYVHRRLDEAGIPTHPNGPHSAEGCRVGDRLDIVLRETARVPDDIRAAGWLVAIHNDYIMDGRRHTFWLFTHNASGRFVKGEAATDAQALNWVRRLIGLPEVR